MNSKAVNWINQPDAAISRPTALRSPSSDGKPEAATAVVELLMMGMRMPETCWTVFKRQVINLRNCCIWLVDSVESMMMHGLVNPKFKRCRFQGHSTNYANILKSKHFIYASNILNLWIIGSQPHAWRDKSNDAINKGNLHEGNLLRRGFIKFIDASWFMHTCLVERLFGRCLFYDFYQLQISKLEGEYIWQKKTKCMNCL